MSGKTLLFLAVALGVPLLGLAAFMTMRPADSTATRTESGAGMPQRPADPSAARMIPPNESIAAAPLGSQRGIGGGQPMQNQQAPAPSRTETSSLSFLRTSPAMAGNRTRARMPRSTKPLLKRPPIARPAPRAAPVSTAHATDPSLQDDNDGGMHRLAPMKGSNFSSFAFKGQKGGFKKRRCRSRARPARRPPPPIPSPRNSCLAAILQDKLMNDPSFRKSDGETQGQSWAAQAIFRHDPDDGMEEDRRHRRLRRRGATRFPCAGGRSTGRTADLSNGTPSKRRPYNGGSTPKSTVSGTKPAPSDPER